MRRLFVFGCTFGCTFLGNVLFYGCNACRIQGD